MTEQDIAALVKQLTGNIINNYKEVTPVLFTRVIHNYNLILTFGDRIILAQASTPAEVINVGIATIEEGKIYYFINQKLNLEELK